MNDKKIAPVIGRFAPTPSARLHLGNLMCALVAWLSARKQGGKILLRVEDLDIARCPFMGENTRYMLDDLAWLGLTFDAEVLYQSQRSDIYEAYFKRLGEKGLIYPCYCSRAELHAATAPHLSDHTPIYDRRCLLRAERGEQPPMGRAPAYRVKVPDADLGFFDCIAGEYRENLLRDCSDFVVRRADGVFAYQLAVVVDDALSGVTEVVRGNDLIFSTPRQIYLQQTLGFATPTYCHIPLLVDANGRRLSKRDGDGCMETVRQKYKNPAPVLGALAAALGLLPAPESVSLLDLVALFDPTKIPRDTVKLPEGF
ncbi:MAG: tRNA glutamyl-Q(34) synthetase GluQRS [Clostridia bacterium]|nr:tRNA glutamyl-Q(34) synthetase GluQRS [Clostridia bacterium]